MTWRREGGKEGACMPRLDRLGRRRGSDASGARRAREGANCFVEKVVAGVAHTMQKEFLIISLVNWMTIRVHRDSERLLHFDTKFEHEDMVLVT